MENAHDLLVGTLSIGIPSFNLKILIGSSWAWPGDQKQNFLPHCMKQIIYIYVIHHATNQLCNKQNINLELSRFSEYQISLCWEIIWRNLAKEISWQHVSGR